MPNSTGPHVIAALICERLLMEQDGVASAIRIIDRIFFTVDESGTPIDPNYQFTIYLNLKSDAARGSYKVKVEVEKPSTEREHIIEAPVLFEGEDRGANVVIQTNLVAEDPGLYWYDVSLDDGDPITRIPMRVVFQSPPVVGRDG
jgi:hypothetical protein